MVTQYNYQNFISKKIASLLASFLIISGTLLAQGVPQSFKYQAVIRNLNGEVIPDTPVELKISILQGLNGGYNLPEFQETHAVTTNRFGLVNLNVGEGDYIIGDFSAIEWEIADYFMSVEVSVNGAPFVNMGTTQLLSVPYAFVAQKAVEGDADADPANELQSLSQTGTEVTLSDGGGTISVADNDNDATNELQNWSNLPGIPAEITDGDDVDDADADPSNELQTLSQTGTEVTLSDGGGTISVADNDNDATNELQNWSNLPGIPTEITDGDDVDDADADPANELQSLSQSGTEVTLSDGGGTISVADNDNDPANELQDWSNLPGIPTDISDGDDVDDADADPANELQILSQSGTDVTLSDGGGTISVADNDNDPANELQDWSNLPGIPAEITDGDDVDDADADPANELQTLSQSGTEVTLSDGGGTFSVADNDNDPANEIELPAGGANGQVLTTDGSGTYSWTDKGGATTYQIGDWAHGGVVFWVDESGQHGLVCAKNDETEGIGFFRWIAGTYGITRAVGDGPFSGEMNTAVIIAATLHIGDDGSDFAAFQCSKKDVTEGGKAYGDWYLPSKAELELMYENRVIVNSVAMSHGGSSFALDYYWSSTEIDIGTAWAHGFFVNGTSIIKNKQNPYPIRAIRAF